MTLKQLTAIVFFFIKLKLYLLRLLQHSVQVQWVTVLLLVSLSLGLSMIINISHWCLVTHRFLAGLFTFLSRQPVVK